MVTDRYKQSSPAEKTTYLSRLAGMSFKAFNSKTFYLYYPDSSICAGQLEFDLSLVFTSDLMRTWHNPYNLSYVVPEQLLHELVSQLRTDLRDRFIQRHWKETPC